MCEGEEYSGHAKQGEYKPRNTIWIVPRKIQGADSQREIFYSYHLHLLNVETESQRNSSFS